MAVSGVVVNNANAIAIVAASAVDIGSTLAVTNTVAVNVGNAGADTVAVTVNGTVGVAGAGGVDLEA